MNRPRLKVDFNEMVQENLVLLSKVDDVIDSEGKSLKLSEGLPISIYEYNEYLDGTKEYLLADGFVELNNPNINGLWSKAAKWCCRINENGIVFKNT
ncbi:hypothetical protein [Spartinivicinus ruber]|uniref:hypothetical protein n=1 Tax=Spartinivicinus ruber TaxID=2683272 RepID=UPI0013D67D05|nr:hypothetical protein [Spartinivicinus ruber]